MGFKTKTRKVRGVQVLEISGDFVGENASKAALLFDEMRTSTGGAVAVDMSETTFIDSVGLGVLIFSWRMLENEHRDMFFVRPKGFVLNMLQNSHLDKVFKIVESI